MDPKLLPNLQRSAAALSSRICQLRRDGMIGNSPAFPEQPPGTAEKTMLIDTNIDAAAAIAGAVATSVLSPVSAALALDAPVRISPALRNVLLTLPQHPSLAATAAPSSSALPLNPPQTSSAAPAASKPADCADSGASSAGTATLACNTPLSDSPRILAAQNSLGISLTSSEQNASMHAFAATAASPETSQRHSQIRQLDPPRCNSTTNLASLWSNLERLSIDADASTPAETTPSTNASQRQFMDRYLTEDDSAFLQSIQHQIQRSASISSSSSTPPTASIQPALSSDERKRSLLMRRDSLISHVPPPINTTGLEFAPMQSTSPRRPHSAAPWPSSNHSQSRLLASTRALAVATPPIASAGPFSTTDSGLISPATAMSFSHLACDFGTPTSTTSLQQQQILSQQHAYLASAAALNASAQQNMMLHSHALNKPPMAPVTTPASAANSAQQDRSHAPGLLSVKPPPLLTSFSPSELSSFGLKDATPTESIDVSEHAVMLSVGFPSVSFDANSASPATPGSISICRYFLQGFCSRGDKCSFAHVMNMGALSANNTATTATTRAQQLSQAHHQNILSQLALMQQQPQSPIHPGVPSQRHALLPVAQQQLALNSLQNIAGQASTQQQQLQQLQALSLQSQVANAAAGYGYGTNAALDSAAATHQLQNMAALYSPGGVTALPAGVYSGLGYAAHALQLNLGNGAVTLKLPPTGAQRSKKTTDEAMSRYAGVLLEDILGQIYMLCKDQHGCRFLQKKLEDRCEKHLSIIFDEVHPHFAELMTDPFGNYLCQKLLEYCTDDQRTRLIEQIAPEIIEISLNMHGTRAIQKLIEFISNHNQIEIVIRALNTNVVALIKDLNGNHVVQKCLNRLSHEDNQFIYNAVTNHCVEVATHRHGCCVLQRCVDHASDAQRVQLVSEITYNVLTLIQDPFGNYVVQYVLDLTGDARFSDAIIRRFIPHMCVLSVQKFSSNVIEKCIRVAHSETRTLLLSELLDKEKLEKLLRDSYGNYVVQTALEYAEMPQRAMLVECIRPLLPSIRNTPYGKRIQSKIMREQIANSGGVAGISAISMNGSMSGMCLGSNPQTVPLSAPPIPHMPHLNIPFSQPPSAPIQPPHTPLTGIQFSGIQTPPGINSIF